MNFLFAASLGLVMGLHGQSGLTLNVNAKNGDTISGEEDFKVTVASTEQINQVEFYIGDELRDTETSTPYTFPLDTVDMPDGDLTVRFKAYTVQNKTVEKTLKLHVDNLKSKGADFHVQAAQDDLTDSKFKEAILEGRIALKIDAQSVGAKIALARANLALHVLDQAQRYAEDATAQDPSNSGAFHILAVVDAQRAFSTFAREESDKADVLTNIADAFKAAADTERKALDLEVDALGPVTDANALQVADAAIRAGRYSLAISVLNPRVQLDFKNNKVVDRLAYAELRSGRYQDLLNLFNAVQGKGSLDAYGDAVRSIVLLEVGKNEDSVKAMTAAIEANPDDLGVRTAQAFIALKQNKTADLAKLANDLGKDASSKVSVNYFLMSILYRTGQYEAARKAFQRGVLAAPAYPDLYIEEGDRYLGNSFSTKASADEKSRSLDLAKMYYDTALVARPEATNALAGLSVLALLKKNKEDAVTFAEASRNSATENGLGHFVLSAAYEAAARPSDAKVEVQKASELDPINLGTRPFSNAYQVWVYMVTSGRTPVLAAPSN